MTTITVNERAEAPDWRALAEAEGAGPGALDFHDESPTSVRICFEHKRITVWTSGRNDWHWRNYDEKRPEVFSSATAALRAALAWLRETLDREIAECQAARGRLGNPAVPAYPGIICPKCGGTSWGGGTVYDLRPWCNKCGTDQPDRVPV